jgi:hypothetical protein
MGVIVVNVLASSIGDGGVVEMSKGLPDEKILANPLSLERVGGRGSSSKIIISWP